MKRNIRAIVGATAALALGLGGSLALAAPAFAADVDVLTPGWEWYDVDDETADNIDDAGSYFPNYEGTGLDLFGFTDDAFDGFLDSFEISYLDVLDYPTFTNVSSVFVDNGLSTIVAEATSDFGDGDYVDITRTLEIQGSYARWTFEFSGPIASDVSVRISGDLGSDSNSKYYPVGSNGMVSTDGPELSDSHNDPVIGYDFQSTSTWSFDVADGDEDPAIEFGGNSTAVLTVGLVDYDPCSFDAAYDAMTALVPTLAGSFGGDIPGHYLINCLEITQPSATPAAINQVLPLTQTAALDDWSYYDDDDAENYLAMLPLDFPAGLVGTLVFNATTGAPSLHLTGTATPGTYSVLFYYYYEDQEGADADGAYPLISTITIGQLAATGAAPLPTLVGAGVLAIVGLGMVLVVGARRRAALTR